MYTFVLGQEFGFKGAFKEGVEAEDEYFNLKNDFGSALTGLPSVPRHLHHLQQIWYDLVIDLELDEKLALEEMSAALFSKLLIEQQINQAIALRAKLERGEIISKRNKESQ